MHYVKKLSDYREEKPSAVTFGKFDGIHLGHQKLIDQVRALEKEKGVVSVVCSFDFRPLWREKGSRKDSIMTGLDRYRCLNNTIDYLVECPFDEEFQNISAETFIHAIIRDILHAKYVVIGSDFCFGKDRRGDKNLLAAYAEECGYELIIVPKERVNGTVISSSFIRQALKEGNLSLTNYLLGYPFALNGFVEHGQHLGTTLGFPTLNLAWPEYKILPPKGVYVSMITLDGQRYFGISNIGVRPTVSDSKTVVVESFLFNFHKEVYGKWATVELLEFRRPEMKFDTIEQMKETVYGDIAYAKQYFGVHG